MSNNKQITLEEVVADFVVIGFSVFVTVIILTWVIIAINEKIKRDYEQQ